MTTRRPWTICTWNVNGLRACANKGFLDWLTTSAPDVLCLQETKAHREQIPPAVAEPAGYRTWFASAVKKGYSGTALYARRDPVDVVLGLGDRIFDDEGRTIVADFGPFTVINGYFPNSQPEAARLDYKLAYFAAVRRRADEVRAAGKGVVITGDFNAAHTEIDLANPKQNENNAGYLPEERSWVSTMLADGWADVFRDRHPGEKGHYTWWTYRMNARARNVGWRLDYFLVSADLVAAVDDVVILGDVLGSDHCPVSLTLRV